MIEMDLVRNLGRACTLLATPTTLKPKQLKSAQAYARRLGNMCDYLATHPDSQTGEIGLAGTLRAELTILIRILDDASKPGRLGRPPKGAPSADDLLTLAEYNSFSGTHKEKVRHLQSKGLINVGGDDANDAWRKHFSRLNDKVAGKAKKSG